ncbi:MAG: NAD(P)H-binding protein [Sphingomonadales bacterium]|nr:NAD(P)H-binding protein [Sphingomonadales bacterium]
MIGRGEGLQVCVVGATGLVGQALIAEGRQWPRFRLTAVARREVPLPPGARLETVLAPVEEWDAALAGLAPAVVVCALGTTRAKAGGEDAFRAVDVDLVLAVARAAKAAGAGHFILVSSVGAAPGSRNVYLRAKGEVEAAVAKLGFRRLDVVRPGLLRGRRAERRPLEWIAQVLAPVLDLLLVGQGRRYRSIRGERLARAILGLATEKAGGRFVHEHDGLLRAEQRLTGPRG